MRCESARRERVCAGRAPPCGEACGGALRRDPCAFWDRFTGGSERESGLEAVAVCGPPGLNAMTGRIHHAQAACPVRAAAARERPPLGLAGAFLVTGVVEDAGFAMTPSSTRGDLCQRTSCQCYFVSVSGCILPCIITPPLFVQNNLDCNYTFMQRHDPPISQDPATHPSRGLKFEQPEEPMGYDSASKHFRLEESRVDCLMMR